MLTPFGKYLRKMRIDKDESMDDMAKRLGVSKTYLSFIENGSREINQPLAFKIMNEYNISGPEAQEFLKAFYATPVKTITLDTGKIAHLEGGIALAQQFALLLPQLNQEQFNEFAKLFNGFIINHNIKEVIGDLS